MLAYVLCSRILEVVSMNVSKALLIRTFRSEMAFNCPARVLNALNINSNVLGDHNCGDRLSSFSNSSKAIRHPWGFIFKIFMTASCSSFVRTSNSKTSWAYGFFHSLTIPDFSFISSVIFFTPLFEFIKHNNSPL